MQCIAKKYFLTTLPNTSNTSYCQKKFKKPSQNMVKMQFKAIAFLKLVWPILLKRRLEN